MKLELGQKIRTLRQNTGMTQETLADVLGVSNQAVSRWESDGGYPDTELLPSIANYFGISMDELFGYSGEREQKISDIMNKADEFLSVQGDMTECIALLRNAVREFPNNAKLLVRLGYALNMDGWEKKGCHVFVKAGSDFTEFDGVKNRENDSWMEAISIFENLLNDPSLCAALPCAD